MRELPLYKIRDLAFESGRSVYNIQQLANLVGRSKEITTVYFNRLVERKMAARLLRGKISFSDNDFIIATQLVEPSYISLDSALLFHEITNQVPAQIQCATPVNSIQFLEHGIVYHKIHPKLFFGYQRYRIEKSYIFVADPEKALIDGYYFNMYTIDDLLSMSENMDFTEVRKQIANYDGRGGKKLKEALALLAKKNY
ncbi:MAG: hypothetical protein M1498_02625 [Candidatus Thermoplasmatota archaeon]|nr:hypothetical protein [Candidatus Thermoplasmatota archaeon]